MKSCKSRALILVLPLTVLYLFFHQKKKVAQSCPDSLRSHGLRPTRLFHPWDFPGKSTGVGCHFLLQRIFLTQGSNPGLPHCRQTLYHLSHQESLAFTVTILGRELHFFFFAFEFHSQLIISKPFDWEIFGPLNWSRLIENLYTKISQKEKKHNTDPYGWFIN